MTVTTHVPALEAESDVPEIAQPMAVPLVTVKLTAPVPCPPLVTRLSAVPGSPFSEVIEIGDWLTKAAATTKVGSLVKVIDTTPLALAVPTTIKPDDVTSYTVSPATMPASVIVKVIGAVAVGDEPSSASQVTASETT